MNKVIIELKFLVMAVVMASILFLSDGWLFPLREVTGVIFVLKMTTCSAFIFYLSASIFSISLLRQINLKFNSVFSNLVLITFGLVLIYYFDAFATLIKNNLHGDDRLKYLLFRLIQYSIGFLAIHSMENLSRLYIHIWRITAAEKGLEAICHHDFFADGRL